MGDSRLRVLALAVLALGGAALGMQSFAARQSAAGARPPSLGDAGRHEDLRFAPEVHPSDRQAILAAVAAGRPAARRVIDRVDGLVTVRVGATGGMSVGRTIGQNGHFDVTLDLATVTRRYGPRGVTRLVLHELGHVVDGAIVPDAVVDELDTQIPRGYACSPGDPVGACASREERFADTFAKWATGDIGVELSLGYLVPPPASVETWGDPLTRLP